MASQEPTKPLRSALKNPDSAASDDARLTNSPGNTRVPLPPSPSQPQTSLPPTPLELPGPAELPGEKPLFNRTATSPAISHGPSVNASTAQSAKHTPTSSDPSTSSVQINEPPPSLSRSAPLHSALHARQPSDSGAKVPYQPKVSFDTFENPLASMFSFTLQVKTAGYKRTQHTRVYLCAASPDESGQQALDWCLESLAQDGDEVIVFRGLEEEALEKDHDLLRANARELMRKIQDKSEEADPERKLSLVLEYVPGKVTDTIDRLIALYRPDTLVVGTRGKRGLITTMGMQLGGIGSVSKYCLSHSPVPVIVVRPERQLKKAVEKRKADPKRGTHFD